MAPPDQSVYVINVVFYYDPRKVSEFLDSIARGFINSPLQYALFGGVILLLVAGLLVAYRVQRGRARRSEDRLGLERFERLALKLGLTGPEREALGHVLEGYNASTEHKLAGVEELKRMFGVFEVPQGITRILVVG